MPEIKETKLVAKRIDIRYHKKPNWFRWWRRWLSIFSVLAALGWTIMIVVGNLRHGKHNALLNPAPVTLVHAHFENNCKACHDSDGWGGFRKGVSDNACLNCHDGARHHPGADLNPGKAGGPHLVNLNNPLKSADCTVCHVEHRGKEANLASDDRLCLQCHEDLNAHGGKSSPVAKTITAFEVGSHPQFGQRLPTTMPGAGPLADNTWGKGAPFHFNHQTHLQSHLASADKNPEHDLPIQSCSRCHTVEETKSLPAGQRAYMRPVTYEEHCKTCHPLALPKTEGLPPTRDLGPSLVHDHLDLVRGQLADLQREYADIAMKSPSPKELLAGKSLEDWSKDQAGKLAADQLKTQESFIENAYSSRLEKLVKQYETWKRPEISKDLDDAKDDLTELPKKSPQARAEYIVAALNAKTKCSKCHELTGEPPLIYEKLVELTLKSPTPTTMPTRMQTAPTGIPKTPPRWFAGSEFAHTPHRDISCLTCHAGMDNDKDDGIARLPTMTSCVECHHPQTSESRGASNNCITCHAFHDRSVERPPTGPLHPQKAATPQQVSTAK